MTADLDCGRQREVSKRLAHTKCIVLFLYMQLFAHAFAYSFIH